jgi:hypothetical protein
MTAKTKRFAKLIPPNLFHDRLVEGELERIILAVDTTNKRKRSYSSSVNRGPLLLELCGVHQEFMTRSELDSIPVTNNKVQLIQSIAKDAKTLRSRLLEKGRLPHEPYTDCEYPTYAARQVISADDLKILLGVLDKVIVSAGACANPAYLGFRGSRSLNETFLSEILPKIYERHFSRKAGFFSQDERAGFVQYGGPYVRFAIAVMEEMEISVSKYAVIKAIKEKRSGKGAGYRKKNAC